VKLEAVTWSNYVALFNSELFPSAKCCLFQYFCSTKSAFWTDRTESWM